MKTYDIRDLAIKLFGVYCLVTFVAILPQVAMIFLASESAMQAIRSRLALGALWCIQFGGYAVFAYLFLFRTAGVVRLIWGPSAPSDQSPDLQVATGLSFWIILIGVFYLIRSVSQILPGLWRVLAQRGMAVPYLWVELVPQAILLVASVLCILRSKDIEGFIQSHGHPLT